MEIIKSMYFKIAILSIFAFLVIFQMIYDIIALSNKSYLSSDFITKDLLITSLVISILLLGLLIYGYIAIILKNLKKQ